MKVILEALVLPSELLIRVLLFKKDVCEILADEEADHV